MKKISDIFSIIVVFTILIVGLMFYKSSKQNSKFEKQKLGITIEKFRADWGKPNKEFINKDDNNLVLVYDCKNYLGDKYIFKFDKKSKILLFKYLDD